MKPITQFQAVELLRAQMEEIPMFKVYYTMKSMKLKGIHQPTTKLMRACFAIHSAGLPITTALLSAMLDKDAGTLVQSLHLLGDKSCLILKRKNKHRGRGGPYEWSVHPVFLNHFYGEEDE